MKIKINDEFELNGKNYITLDLITYQENKYIFVNELTKDEEPTKKFLVFKCLDNGLLEEKNNDLLRPLLSEFSENMNKKLEVINK